MPKIPTYNQGQQVPLATGQLGPRLSGAGLERGMLAGVKTTQQALGAVADIATAFEKRRQNELQEDFIANSTNELRENLSTLRQRTNPQTVEEWNTLYEDTVTEFKNNLDTPAISKSRLQSAMRKLDSVGQLYKLQGIKDTFDIEQTNKAVTAAKGLDQTTSEYVSGLVSRNDALLAHAEAYDFATRSGFNDKLPTTEEFAFALDTQLLVSMANDPDATYQGLQQKISEIEAGGSSTVDEEGREVLSLNEYSTYLPSERDKLISILESRTNKMATEETGEAIARGNDAISSMALAETDEDYDVAFKNGASEVAKLRALGSEAEANKLQSKLNAADATRTFFADDVVFSNAADRAEAAEEKRQELMAAMNTDNAAEVMEAIKALDVAEAAVAKQINEDPAAYVISNFKRRNDREPTRAEIIQRQKDMGLSGAQLTPFTNNEFTELQEVTSSLDAVNTYKEFERFFGQFNGETKDIAEARAMRLGMSPAMNIALMREGDPGAIQLLMADKMDTQELNGKIRAIEGVSLVDIERAVIEETADFRKSILGDVEQGFIGMAGNAARTKSVDNYQASILKLAKTLVSRGSSVEDAAEAAAAVINDRYDFEEFGNNGMIRIPKQHTTADVSSSDMVEVLDYFLRDEDFVAKIDFPGSPADRQAFLRDLRSGMGTWMTSEDETGVYLVDDFENPVYLSKNSLGEPVRTRAEVSFVDLVKIMRDARKPEDLPEEQEVLQTILENLEEAE